MNEPDRDTLLRLAAFDHVRRLGEVHDHLTATELKPGFVFDGERIPLINPQRGIFKPQQMQFLLSIKTVFPKPGGKVWYDDQREVHRQIFEGDETIDYAFMGQDPDAADNRWLREAFENQIPIIYFLGIAPGRYQAMLPTFICGWDGKALKARVAFGAPDQETLAPPETALERRYALREDIAPAIEALKDHAEALYVIGDPFVNTHRLRINTFALAGRLPTMHSQREFVEAAGLISYGPNFQDMWRRAGDYVDKILRGAKPGDLPVEQPTKFDLVINLITANALGLTVPDKLLALADELIE